MSALAIKEGVGADEQHRLAALDRYDVLDTAPEEAFDRVTRLVRLVFGVPISTVPLVDAHRLWLKSQQGLGEICELARKPSFCDCVVSTGEPLVVPDTLLEPRFAGSPHVVGPPFLRFYAGMPLRASDGSVIGALCAMDTSPHTPSADQLQSLSDLAGIIMSELELRVLTVADSVTGVLARRAFGQEAARAASLALRHRHDLSYLVLDVDNFGAVVESHGYAIGDKVLKAVTDACRSKLRKSDLIGRAGGDSIAIVLPHTGAFALDVAEKLRTAVAKLRVPTAQGELQATISVGVATLDRSIKDADGLADRADLALREAKADGRNRCKLWQHAAVAEPSIRRRVLKAGRITFLNGHSAIDCTVRSLSDVDASVDVISSAGIPDTFKLQIESDGIHRAARIVSKTERRLELAFQ
jgi:diguanylate cyclase (GGDEF)-like protein